MFVYSTDAIFSPNNLGMFGRMWCSVYQGPLNSTWQLATGLGESTQASRQYLPAECLSPASNYIDNS